MTGLVLKASFRALIGRVGGLDAAAACCRLGRSQLAAAYAPGEAATYPPADVIAALEVVAGEPLVTAELARQAGYRLVALDPPAESDALILPRVAALMRETGTLAADVADALADGAVSARERRELLVACAAVMRQAEAVRAACGATEGDA